KGQRLATMRRAVDDSDAVVPVRTGTFQHRGPNIGQSVSHHVSGRLWVPIAEMRQQLFDESQSTFSPIQTGMRSVVALQNLPDGKKLRHERPILTGAHHRHMEV